MIDYILDNYIKPLNPKENNLVGVYRQGSDILGYSDEHSDVDYSVVWKDNYPNNEVRKEILSKLDVEINYIGDAEHKGTDRFIFKGIEHNVSHRLDYNFFRIYEEVQTSKVNEPKLYILGGFQRGKIIHDPKNQLKQYLDQLTVTQDIIDVFKESRKNSTLNNLKSLEIAAHRKQPVEYIKSLNYLLITFCIQLYLENRQFPMAPKWIEKDAEKFGWANPLLDAINSLKSELPFVDIKSLLNRMNAILANK